MPTFYFTVDLIAPLVVAFVISFLLGSIPWGVIISRVFFHTDVRDHGSGNIGTTNALRTMGKVGGGAVFVLDFGKGIVSGLLSVGVLYLFADAGWVSMQATFAVNDFLGVAFAGCVWGHIFSPWLGFHGGKGIAVAVGCLFITFGVVGALLELLIFAVLVVATKYVSVGSIAAAVACPFFSAYYFLFTSFDPIAFVLVSAGAITVVWAHRGNIERLRAGNERRIGSKKEA